LALASLNAPGLALFFGLLYGAVAFLRPSERRQMQLTVSTAAIALWLLLSSVVLMILVAMSADGGAGEQAQDISLTRGDLAMSLASGVVITLAVALVAVAFYTGGRKRYLLFAWSGLCLTAYYILLLPSVARDITAPSTLGSFWANPLSFGKTFLGIVAGLIIAASFWWYGGAARDDAAPQAKHDNQSGLVRFALGEREYLLALAAALLLLSFLAELVFADWGLLRPADDQTTSGASFQVLLFLASRLFFPVLFGSATFAFWTSARQAGWAPTHLLRPAAADAMRGDPTLRDATPGEAGPGTATSRPPAAQLLLTWRLPLLLAWLIVLVAATSFLGWYGFLAVVPAAAHYLWMRVLKPKRPADVE